MRNNKSILSFLYKKKKNKLLIAGIYLHATIILDVSNN